MHLRPPRPRLLPRNGAPSSIRPASLGPSSAANPGSHFGSSETAEVLLGLPLERAAAEDAVAAAGDGGSEGGR
eukprot:9484574-Pyramimonas_sp.AAC.1